MTRPEFIALIGQDIVVDYPFGRELQRWSIFRCRNAKFFLCVLGLRYPIFRLIITDRSLP